MAVRLTSSARLPGAVPAALIRARLGIPHAARPSAPASRSHICFAARKRQDNGSPMELAGVTFEVQRHVDYGDSLCVVGDAEALGGWDPCNGVVMEWREGDIWTAQVELPLKETIQYKYIVKHEDAREVEWQPGENEVHSVEAEGKVVDEWQRFDEAAEGTGAEEAAVELAGEEGLPGGRVGDGDQEDAGWLGAKEPGIEEETAGPVPVSSAEAVSEGLPSEPAEGSKKPAKKTAARKKEDKAATVHRVT
ncbi:unnamed protein product [Ostreobium quekettii]|uniref:CBM20 domain-containing protein n=1 Tax=Ostreobium quekettii TaxID=121088 RepID=A0A8S1IKZ1_9CHLO|nr:unnamed protein product [Ostreobium quekettii]|eukprot:evm.model.scf_337.8 EVM.evm.TU.scf_337.8   scf_337:59678-61316(+)